MKSKLSRLFTVGNRASLMRRSTIRRSRSISSSSRWRAAREAIDACQSEADCGREFFLGGGTVRGSPLTASSVPRPPTRATGPANSRPAARGLGFPAQPNQAAAGVREIETGITAPTGKAENAREHGRRGTGRRSIETAREKDRRPSRSIRLLRLGISAGAVRKPAGASAGKVNLSQFPLNPAGGPPCGTRYATLFVPAISDATLRDDFGTGDTWAVSASLPMFHMRLTYWWAQQDSNLRPAD